MHITPPLLPPAPPNGHHHDTQLPEHLHADITPGYGRTPHRTATARHDKRRRHDQTQHNPPSKDATQPNSVSSAAATVSRATGWIQRKIRRANHIREQRRSMTTVTNNLLSGGRL